METSSGTDEEARGTVKAEGTGHQQTTTDSGNRQQSTVGMVTWTGIGEFHDQDGHDGEKWADYIERFEFACVGQGVEIDDVTKRARLLSGLGQEGYRKVKTILAPSQLSEVPSFPKSPNHLEEVGIFSPDRLATLTNRQGCARLMSRESNLTRL